MKYAFQIDPLSSLNLKIDSSWLLIKEAFARGLVFYFTPSDVFWKNGELYSYAYRVRAVNDNSYELEDLALISLTEMDVIFIRQDPPYDMNYLTYTYLLEKISSQVLILNDPRAIRNFPEKLSVLNYPDLIPSTLITSSILEVEKFLVEHHKIVIKPLYSFAGNGVFYLEQDDYNLSVIIDSLLKLYRSPIIAQQYIPISSGDKRIIIVDGEVAGIYARLPKSGDIRANVAQGGIAMPCNLSEQDHKICEALVPMLRENNLFLVGVDVIEGCLMEINVTSPTGLVAIKDYTGIDPSKLIFNKISDKLTYSCNKN